MIKNKIHLKIDIGTYNPVEYYYIPKTLKNQLQKVFENNFNQKFDFEVVCGAHTSDLINKGKKEKIRK